MVKASLSCELATTKFLHVAAAVDISRCGRPIPSMCMQSELQWPMFCMWGGPLWQSIWPPCHGYRSTASQNAYANFVRCDNVKRAIGDASSVGFRGMAISNRAMVVATMLARFVSASFFLFQLRSVVEIGGTAWRACMLRTVGTMMCPIDTQLK